MTPERYTTIAEFDFSEDNLDQGDKTVAEPEIAIEEHKDQEVVIVPEVMEDSTEDDRRIWNSEDLNHTRDLPKTERVVRYRENGSDQWKRSVI